MRSLAHALRNAGAPGLPAAILTRELKAYEIEFDTLVFHEDVELPAPERAMLALTQALGKAGPADFDGYLGIGPTVAEALVPNLLARRLLRLPNPVTAVARTLLHRLVAQGLALWRRLFRRAVSPEPTAVVAQIPARKVRDTSAAATPLCELTSAGEIALQRGSVLQARERPARLLFVAEPLLYLGTIDEKRSKYAQYHRARPLEPEAVPEPFMRMDSILAQPPKQRFAECGIERHVHRYKGTLLGIKDGTQWEVREVASGNTSRRNSAASRTDSQNALLVLAAFPATDRGLLWRVFLQWRGKVLDCASVEPAKLLAPSLRSRPGLLAAIDTGALDIPLPETFGTDGALELSCDEARLSRFLGDADRPEDAFLDVPIPGWQRAGLRARAKPAGTEALRAAFYEFLGRRDAQLRADFDGTCLAVAKMLREHWGMQNDLPSADEAASHLWAVPRLRAALCMRRLAADLIEPYAERTPLPVESLAS